MSNSTCQNTQLVPIVAGGTKEDGLPGPNTGAHSSGEQVHGVAYATDATSQQQQQQPVPLVSATQEEEGKTGPNADAQSFSCGCVDQSSADPADVVSTDLSFAATADSKPTQSGRPGRRRKKKRGRKKQEDTVAVSTNAPDLEAKALDAKSKPRRGRPRNPKGDNANGSVPIPRAMPDRDVKIVEEVTSITVRARNRSRSTGRRANSLSAYDLGYHRENLASQQVEDGAGMSVAESSELLATLDIDDNVEGASQSSAPPPAITHLSGVPQSSSKSVQFSLHNDTFYGSPPSAPPPRIMEEKLPEPNSVRDSPLAKRRCLPARPSSQVLSNQPPYGMYVFGCGGALYSGETSNGKPDGCGKLFYKDRRMGGENHDVTVSGTFREGLLIHGREVTASGVLIYEGAYKCEEADGRVSFYQHGSGKLFQRWVDNNYMEYDGQFRAGNIDGQGELNMNGDEFYGLFYPSLNDDLYLIPFVGTRKLPDGSTDFGTFLLNVQKCFKVADISFESGIVLFIEEDGRQMKEISIDEVFKGNDEGVPSEYYSAFQILECERTRRLSNPSYSWWEDVGLQASTDVLVTLSLSAISLHSFSRHSLSGRSVVLCPATNILTPS